MKRLLTRLLILTAALCLCCTTTILIGHADTRPDELQQLGFDVCDGVPCFMGIIPGVTSWDEVTTRLANRSDIQYAGGDATYFGTDFRGVQIFNTTNGGANHNHVSEAI